MNMWGVEFYLNTKHKSIALTYCRNDDWFSDSHVLIPLS